MLSGFGDRLGIAFSVSAVLLGGLAPWNSAQAGIFDRLFRKTPAVTSCDVAVTEATAILEGKLAPGGRPYANLSEVVAPEVAQTPDAIALKALSADLHNLPPGEAWVHSPEGFDYVVHDQRVYVRQAGGQIFAVEEAAISQELATSYFSTAEKAALINRRAHAIEKLFGQPLATRKIGGGGFQMVQSLEGGGSFPKSVLDQIPGLKGRKMSDFVLKIPTADDSKAALLFGRDRAMYGQIEAELNKSGSRMLKTYFYEDANGTRFVLQEKLPPGTKSFAETVDGYLKGMMRADEYGPLEREELFALEVDLLPLSNPKYKMLGVDTNKLAALRRNPEYQRFVSQMRAARDLADSPPIASAADGYWDKGIRLTNKMAWSESMSKANLDFSWENGRVLPNGQIVWFDF